MPGTGRVIGTGAGAAAGSVIPGVGTAIGGAVGGYLGGLFGKRGRSSCRIVSAADLEGFYAGRIAPWVVWDRVDDIGAAWGMGPPDTFLQDGIRQRIVAQIGSYRAVAELHTQVFVPLCEQLEGGQSGFTSDPNSGPGLETYRRAREAFRQWVRSGARGQYAEAPPAGATGPGGAFVPGGEPGPRQAGTGTGNVAGLAGLAIVGLLLASGG